MVALVLSLLLLAAPHRSRPAPPPPPPPRGPIGVPSPEVLHALEGADSVIVYALGDRVAPGSVRPDLYGREVLNIVRAEPNVQFHATQILSDVMLYQEGEGISARRLTDPARSRYALQFVGRDTVTALLLLAEPCVEIRDGNGLAGRGIPDAVRWNALIQLARESGAGAPLALDPPVDEEYTFVDSLPQVMDGRTPEYPVQARSAGTEGTVLVQARVGTDGRVLQARVIHSVAGLDAAAIDAVCRWRFRPALARGKPVVCWVAVPVAFSLH